MCRKEFNIWNSSRAVRLQERPIFLISSDVSDVSDEISDEISDLNFNQQEEEEEEKQNNVNDYSNDVLLPGQVDENLD